MTFMHGCICNIHLTIYTDDGDELSNCTDTDYLSFLRRILNANVVCS